MEPHTIASTANFAEQIVGTFSDDDIFCSLLFDRRNRTLRVVDFKSGNFPPKRDYLKKRLKLERLRKVFTLVEFSEVKGWKSIGYRREGTIPAYFNRSDAHIMSCIFSDDYDIETVSDTDAPKLEKFLHKVEILATQMSKQKKLNVEVAEVTEEEAIEAIGKELQRRKKSKSRNVKKSAPKTGISDLSDRLPIFSQFGREMEYLYFAAKRSQTDQTNVIGAEYQNNFGNAKVDVYFSPEKKTEMRFVRSCFVSTIDHLRDKGVKTVFSMVPENDLLLNALYWSTGFCNTGLLYSQRLGENGPQNLLLWTRKLT